VVEGCEHQVSIQVIAIRDELFNDPCCQQSGVSMPKNIARNAGLRVIAAFCLIISAQSAMAQNLANLSCGQLWYERNAVYAMFGYCFKTDQAIRTFGQGCYPPYGRLPGWAEARVAEIQAWERRKGCE
jgi:hypothetical protein